jgi:N-acetylglucosamine-6-phosphate deacetylase
MSEHAEIYEHSMVGCSDANIVFSKLRGMHRQLGPEERIRGDHHVCAKQCVEALRAVTVAPELPGANTLIKTIRGIGAVAAIGHSDATYEQTLAGISAGARHATRLFNAMRVLHHRDPGVVGAALFNKRARTC